MVQHNDVLLRALRKEPVPYTPVWIMRQAGRYLPEYRATRARAGSFLALCKTPELACEVTLQPLQRFALDAAILFSDILTIPDAMGLGLDFIEGEGPRFAKRISSHAEIMNLPIPDPEVELDYVLKAVKLIQQELAGRLPLIGFSGSPFTLAAYMIEGGSSKNFAALQKMLQETPELLQLLLTKLTTAVTRYLQAQIDAGVDVVMIFDSWGGLLSDAQYEAFSLHPIETVLTALAKPRNAKAIPRIVYARGAGKRLESLRLLSTEAIGIDEHSDLARAKALLSPNMVLQGNFATELLKQNDANIIAEVQRLLSIMGQDAPYIFNLGHGITPDIDPEKLGLLIDTVHARSLRTIEPNTRKF